jgi:hypothetical protein
VTLQVVASPIIVIMTALEISFMLLKNISTLNDFNIFIVQATGVPDK